MSDESERVQKKLERGIEGDGLLFAEIIVTLRTSFNSLKLFNYLLVRIIRICNCRIMASSSSIILIIRLYS